MVHNERQIEGDRLEKKKVVKIKNAERKVKADRKKNRELKMKIAKKIKKIKKIKSKIKKINKKRKKR